MRYSAALPALPLGLSGSHFVAVAGAQTSSLEALLVKRGLRGPGWATLSSPTRREGSGMVRAAAGWLLVLVLGVGVGCWCWLEC